VIGKEIADVLSPFIMWGGLVGLILVVLYFCYRILASGAVAKDDLEELVQAQEDNADARERLKATRRRMRGSFLDGWLRRPKDK